MCTCAGSTINMYDVPVYDLNTLIEQSLAVYSIEQCSTDIDSNESF